MLALFVFCSCCNAIHWIQYSIITNVVTRYFSVSSNAINLTAISFGVCYVSFVLPAFWLLSRYGLRVTVLSGAAVMVAGAWLKVLSVNPHRFWLAFLGQALVGTSQVFILGMPAQLAAVWFGPRQVSTACALGVIGNQVGIALGFLIPPAVVKNHDELDDIGHDLNVLCYGYAIGPTVVLVLLLVFFQKEPPLPPSPAQATVRCLNPMSNKSVDSHTYLQTFKSLFTNRSFVLLLVSYGVNAGVFYAMSPLLNQIVLLHFEGAEEDAGRIGLTIVVAGVIGSFVGGVMLDKTHWFKQSALLVYLMSLTGMLAFTFTLTLGYIWITYLIGMLLGFFMIGYIGIGFEFAAELTYPIPEGISSGVLMVTSEIFGIVFTVGGGELLNHYGDKFANLAFLGLLVVGLAMTTQINGKDLRRQAVTVSLENQTTSNNMSALKPSTIQNPSLCVTSNSVFPS